MGRLMRAILLKLNFIGYTGDVTFTLERAGIALYSTTMIA